jgi:intein/homing endonuclease
LVTQIVGLVADDDGTGRLRLRTEGVGTDEMLELTGDASTLQLLGFAPGQRDVGETARIPLVADVQQYQFDDIAGTDDDFYQIDFIDPISGLTSPVSDVVQGELFGDAPVVPKQQADGRAPRGLTLVRGTTHVFREAFFADDAVTPLLPLDNSRYPSFQILDVNGQLISAGLCTLDGSAGHYRVEFFVPKDATLSNDDRRYRLEWNLVDDQNRQFQVTTEFDVRDVDVTATQQRDQKFVAMCDKPFRLFIRELSRPASIRLDVQNANGLEPLVGPVVWPGTGASGEVTLTEVQDGETYIYYHDVGENLLKAYSTYQAIWTISDSLVSAPQYAFQIIEVPPPTTLQHFASLRMAIDKYQKKRSIIQAYQDSDIYELTSYTITTLPNPLTAYWLLGSQIWALNAQHLLEVDLSFNFCLDREALVRTERGLIKLKNLGGVNARALAAERLVRPEELALIMAVTQQMYGRYRAQAIADRVAPGRSGQRMGLLLSRAGLTHTRTTDHAGGWLWDTTEFVAGLNAMGLDTSAPPSFTTAHALRSGGQDRGVRCVYDLGEKPCFRLTTELGYEEIGTEKHAFLTIDPQTLETAWTPLGKIRPHDVVAVDRTPDIAGTWDVTFEDVSTVNTTQATKSIYRLPEKLTPALARVLGYLVAEGSTNQYNSVTFGITDPQVLDNFARDFEDAFGLPPDDLGFGVQHPGQFAYDPSRHDSDMHYVRGCGVELRRFLASIGLGYGKSRDKEIPWCILQAPLDLVAEFLKTYFDGDGCFRSDQLFFCSYSDRLRYQVQALLLRFGIVSRNADYVVTIRQPSLAVYADRVGFLHKRGEIADTEVTIREALPTVLSQRLHRITELFGIRHGWRDHQRYTMGWARRDLKRINVRHVADWCADNAEVARTIDPDVTARIEALLDPRFLWQEVKSIEAVGMRHVMDPALHGGPNLLDHSFTAGGFVTHNSGQTVMLDYDHMAGIEAGVQRALDFLNERLTPAKTALYRRAAGVGSFAGKPYRYAAIHNFTFPIARFGSQDFLTLLSNIGLL